MENFDFPLIIKNFEICGNFHSINPYGSGHIHDTFQIKNTDPTCPDYLLQRINNHAFKKVPELMENIEKVTSHLRKKLQSGNHSSNRETLTLVPTKESKFFFKDSLDNFWRMFVFIPDTKSFDLVVSPEQAYLGGKAFGNFQALLNDLPPESLHETIPDFHNVERRLHTFYETLMVDPLNKVQDVQPEINFIIERAEIMTLINKLGREGRIPLRITHNDTKFNNILFDKTGNTLCVIDLDTVMPGYAVYDFGDSIRTTINTAAEDEKDLNKIQIDLSLFEAYSKGYLEETKFFLNPVEIDHLVFGSKLLSYLMGLRFLTDYIDGNKYYKTNFPEHNLQRARAQFQLIRKIEENYDKMQNIIYSILNSLN